MVALSDTRRSLHPCAYYVGLHVLQQKYRGDDWIIWIPYVREDKSLHADLKRYPFAR